MRFSVELVVEVDEMEMERQYGTLGLFLDFKKNGVTYNHNEKGIVVQAFHFGGQQTQLRLVNLMPQAGRKEEPI